MYGSEIWSFTVTLEKKVERFVLKFLRVKVDPKQDRELRICRRKAKKQIIAETKQSTSLNMKVKMFQ